MIFISDIVKESNVAGPNTLLYFRVLSYQIGRVLTGLPRLPMLTIRIQLKLELALELTWLVIFLYDLKFLFLFFSKCKLSIIFEILVIYLIENMVHIYRFSS